MPTIHDVAAACGVSARTVSRVMNDRANVRADTRRVVLEAAERLGYSPDPAARALQSGRRQVVGIVVNSVSSDATLKRIEVVSKLFNAAGYGVLMQFAENGEVEEAAIRGTAPRCDALVVFTNLRAPASEALDELSGRRYPFIVVDPPRSVPYPSVHLDRRSGYREAVRYLVHKGRRRLTLVLEDFRSTERLAGFREGLEAEGLSFGDDMVIRTGKGFEGGRDAAPETAEAVRTGRAEGVLCHNDKLALGIMSRLSQWGIRVPDDVSVVGFDDDAYAAYLTPALTTIAQGGGDMGAYIFQQIRNTMEYGSPVESKVFGTGLIIRGSA